MSFMSFLDGLKRRGPTPEEQSHWESLAAAERDRRREIRKQELQGRGDSKHRMLDQMRNFK
ncbi:MAG: hypothetical protein WD602_06535 [Actinomycetota bacterium]